VSRKTITINKEVWRRLQELKLKLEKRNLSEVIEELLKIYEQHANSVVVKDESKAS
jgi:Uncharacterized ACR, COG1753.